jgi:predicted nucleic acid-binding protein
VRAREGHEVVDLAVGRLALHDAEENPDESGDVAKVDRAKASLAKGGSISVQVLNELANVARRKMQMSWDETCIQAWTAFLLRGGVEVR